MRAEISTYGDGHKEFYIVDNNGERWGVNGFGILSSETENTYPFQYTGRKLLFPKELYRRKGQVKKAVKGHRQSLLSNKLVSKVNVKI